MISTCGAEDPASVTKIDQALQETQDYMNVDRRDWKTPFYQLANRLAFLYFLNVHAKVPVWLALINFVNDQTHIPTSLEAWRTHFAEVFRWAGVRDRSPLFERVVLVYPDAR